MCCFTLWDVSHEYVQQIDVLLCTLWDVSQECKYVLLCTLWDVSHEYVQQIDVLLCTLWDVSQEYVQQMCCYVLGMYVVKNMFTNLCVVMYFMM